MSIAGKAKQGIAPAGVTGVILAGGESSRMGSNKALLPYRGGRFIESIHRLLAQIFDEVLLVTNTAEQYDFLPCRKVADIYPGRGALAGLHAALQQSRTSHIFAVACDMPYLNGELIKRLGGWRERGDVVIPHGEMGPEPLHAVYGKRCLDPMERALLQGRRRIVSFFPEVRVWHVPAASIAEFDPHFDSFKNINTPKEYFALRDEERALNLSYPEQDDRVPETGSAAPGPTRWHRRWPDAG